MLKRLKKHVSAPSLLKRVRSQFDKVKDYRKESAWQKIPLVDCLMSGLAMFSLKCPSLLQFDKNRKDERVSHNLRTLYHVEEVPCDTYMRERLDVVEPCELRRAYTRIWAALQRQGTLKRYHYYDEHVLLSLDGTGFFSSHEVHCESCCVKKHRDGSQTYYHQMLAAVMVHPDEKTVLPMAPEPILKQDGHRKNDCEMNAAKRQLSAIRREHPFLKMIVVEDALYSKAPHIQLVGELNMRYIIGAKPDDHEYLFEFIRTVKVETIEEYDEKGTCHRYSWFNGAPLNDANADCLVSFLSYEEITSKGKKQRFTWVTDLPLSEKTVRIVMRAGRARWKIENETFNTLKTQDYHFEHNYGHGKKHLSTVMAMLMMLAFLIDQVQETCCDFFQRALKKMDCRREMWRQLCGLFHHFYILKWEDVYNAIANKSYGGVLNTS